MAGSGGGTQESGCGTRFWPAEGTSAWVAAGEGASGLLPGVEEAVATDGSRGEVQSPTAAADSEADKTLPNESTPDPLTAVEGIHEVAEEDQELTDEDGTMTPDSTAAQTSRELNYMVPPERQEDVEQNEMRDEPLPSAPAFPELKRQSKVLSGGGSPTKKRGERVEKMRGGQ